MTELASTTVETARLLLRPMCAGDFDALFEIFTDPRVIFFFDSLSRAPDIHNPLLRLIGGADQAVPPALSQKLADRWGGETTVKIYEGEDHSLLLNENSSWTDINAFLQGISSIRS